MVPVVQRPPAEHDRAAVVVGDVAGVPLNRDGFAVGRALRGHAGVAETRGVQLHEDVAGTRLVERDQPTALAGPRDGRCGRGEAVAARVAGVGQDPGLEKGAPGDPVEADPRPILLAVAVGGGLLDA